MAATPVLTKGTTARTSATVSIPAGSIYNFFLTTDAGESLPADGGAAIYIVDSAGVLSVAVAELDAEHNFSAAIPGPLDVKVVIPASDQNLGVEQYP